MSESQITVAIADDIALIRLIGRGTHEHSQNLRDFCLEIVDSEVKKIVMDLSECATMDSTFMGVLAMIGLRMRATKRPFEIINADAPRRNLLTTLGIDKLFSFSTPEADDPVWASLCCGAGDPKVVKAGGDKMERAQTMLESHEALMKIDRSNIPKFKDVVQFLKEDIKSINSK